MATSCITKRDARHVAIASRATRRWGIDGGDRSSQAGMQHMFVALPEVPHFYGNPAGPVFTISYKSHKVINTFKREDSFVDPVYRAYKVVKRSKSGRITKVVHMRRFRKTPP